MPALMKALTFKFYSYSIPAETAAGLAAAGSVGALAEAGSEAVVGGEGWVAGSAEAAAAAEARSSPVSGLAAGSRSPWHNSKQL